MKKNILDDISIPAQRKSIKNIPLPNRNFKPKNEELEKKDVFLNKETIDLRNNHIKKEIPEKQKEEYHVFKSQNPIYEEQDIPVKNYSPKSLEEKEMEEDEEEDYEYENIKVKQKINKNNNSKSMFKIISIFLGALVIIIISMSIFKSASLTVYTKNESLSNIENNIPLQNESTSENNEGLKYKEITLDSVAEIKSESDKEEIVQEKASGIITVFNEYSKEPQKLIKNTRFETKDGKIYRIAESLTVPGYTENNGQKNAGNVDVKVYADMAGTEYNIESAEFTIPGFKNQPQFDFFKAKTKTPIVNGFDGVRKIITEDKKEIVKKELQARIVKNLKEMISKQITADFVYFDNSEDYVFQDLEQGEISGNEVTMRMRGSVKFIIINKNELAKEISRLNIKDYKGENVKIENFDSLETKLIKESDNKKSLSVKGSPKIIWENDLEKFKKDILGTNSKNILDVTSKYSGIVKIDDVIIRPFWTKNFPKKEGSIKITEKIAQ